MLQVFFLVLAVIFLQSAPLSFWTCASKSNGIVTTAAWIRFPEKILFPCHIIACLHGRMRAERKRKKMKKKKKGENSGASTWTFIADTHAASQIPRWEKEKKREQVLRGRKGGKKKKKRDKPDKLDINMAGRVSPLSFFFFFSLCWQSKGNKSVNLLWLQSSWKKKKERKKEISLILFFRSFDCWPDRHGWNHGRVVMT